MAAKAAIPPQQLADTWAAGFTAAAQQKFKTKVQNLQVNPMALAATPEAEAKFLQSVTDSVTSGRRANALNSVDPAFWKSQTAGAGAQNWMTSVNKGKPKYSNKMAKWSGVYAQASAAAASATGVAAKVLASVNVLRAAAGRTPLA
jgi:hypothetical protein